MTGRSFLILARNLAGNAVIKIAPGFIWRLVQMRDFRLTVLIREMRSGAVLQRINPVRDKVALTGCAFPDGQVEHASPRVGALKIEP